VQTCHEIEVFTNRAWSIAAYRTDDIRSKQAEAPEMIVRCFLRPRSLPIKNARRYSITWITSMLCAEGAPAHPSSGDLRSVQYADDSATATTRLGLQDGYHDRSSASCSRLSRRRQCRRKGCRCIQTRVHSIRLLLPVLCRRPPVWRLPRSGTILVPARCSLQDVHRPNQPQANSSVITSSVRSSDPSLTTTTSSCG